mmetsp:Transcript_20063/g.33122  ORF Transcript_20063/g.33122 Transcript_20063/m.33122 type:complete len:231 (-) Transcript_20063:129-821(-)
MHNLSNMLGILCLGIVLGQTQACNPQGETNIKIGSQTYVCLVQNNNKYILGTPRADDYTRLTVPGSFQETQAACTDNYFHIETMGVRSSYRKKFSNCGTSSNTYFPILVAVINVDMGTVKNVTWDDGCYFTDGDVSTTTQECIANAYSSTTTSALSTIPAPGVGTDTAISEQSCSSQGSTFCDLAVYVTWTGRDVDGNYFGSVGRRFSIFRDYGLKPQFEAMQLFLLDKK